jgi:release factor glutamine methyltransferase
MTQPAPVLTKSLLPQWLTGLLVKLLHRFYRLQGKHRYDDFRLERIGDVPILVIPGVFNPKLLRTGAFFAATIDSTRVAADKTVLDMGTGSGVCAVFAAPQAQRVVAVDINAAAARCAGINAQMNRLEHKIEVRHGDLFDAVAEERFDLVLFNPPFLRGTPRNDRDRAWRSTDVAERFAAGLDSHLRTGGAALMLLSTYGDVNLFLDPLRQHGFDIRVFAHRQYFGEGVTIYQVARPAPVDRSAQAPVARSAPDLADRSAP